MSVNSHRRKLLTSFILPVAALSVGVTPSLAQDPVQIRFATVGVGSAWYNYGAGIADMVKPTLAEGSTIDVLPIAGGVGNIKLLQKGEAELGISFPMTSAEGCGGYGAFDSKQDKVRALIGGLDIYYFGTFVTRKSGAATWQDIIKPDSGFRLLTTKVGGTGETGVRQVLALLGSSKDAVAKNGGSVKAMERKATASAIADGNADGWAHVVTKGHPVATQLTTTTDMLMLPLPDDVIAGMTEKHGWLEATVPPNTFNGQTEPVKTVKASSNILVSADVPDEVAYAFAKTMVENAEELKKVHAGLTNFDPKSAADPAFNGNCPLHPGAEKYYQEAGLLK